MAIKEPILFITIEEFKNSKYFNELLFDKVTTPDNEIWFAISVASNNIDYLSGFTISKKWPEITPTDFTDNIQTATTHYVRFLLTKDVDYLRGQGSISQGGLTYSETNPDDPYFIPPEVFNCLRKIKEYPNIKGFNLKGIESQKNNWFNKFISNYGEDSPLNAYIPYNNIKSLDSRTKVTISHPQNLLRPIVNIDTSGIKTDIDNSLWEVITDNPNFIKPKDDKGIDANSKRIIDVGTPTFLSDATTKEYVDRKIDEECGYLDTIKQNKLTAGKNITIDDDIISATGGSGESLWEIDPNNSNIIQPKEKRIITSNNKRIIYIADPEQPQDAVNKRYVDNKIQPIPSIPQWKEVGTKVNINHIKYTFKSNNKYKIYYNFESQSSIKKFAFICKEFLYGELNTDVQTLDWDKVNDRIIVSLQMQNDTIAIVSDPTRYGQLLKLEELQE
ncbi:hypothetical protein [Spiroplasma endosymbiont of Zeiraphera isertana]|uniref:hypothetical protein n=1 Tax=Spiroplasma endosymbiont of Zeiraphera isertana TaxID=3066313 RepID=UPI00313EECBD